MDSASSRWMVVGALVMRPCYWAVYSGTAHASDPDTLFLKTVWQSLGNKVLTSICIWTRVYIFWEKLRVKNSTSLTRKAKLNRSKFIFVSSASNKVCIEDKFWYFCPILLAYFLTKALCFLLFNKSLFGFFINFLCSEKSFFVIFTVSREKYGCHLL